MRIVTWSLWTVLAAVFFLSSACQYDVELYCCTGPDCPDGVEQSCDRWSDDYPERTFCDLEGEYGEGVANTCIEPPAGRCAADGDCAASDAAFCDVEAQSCRGCDGDGECADRNADTPICDSSGACVAACESSSECGEPTAPLCVDSGFCAGCEAANDSDGACADLDPDAPFCVSDGSCAECRDNDHCSEGAQVCDADRHQCRPCEAHAECASDVCDLDAGGACIAEGQVIYVDHRAEASNEDCTREAPCPTIEAGIAAASTSNRSFMHVAPGAYTETIAVSDHDFSLIAHEVELTPADSGEPALRVEAPADLTIDGLRLTGATGSGGDGLRCTAGASRPDLRLRHVRIDDNRRGINASDCILTLEASQVSSNDGPGISATDGILTLEASQVSSNDGPGISATDGSLTLEASQVSSNDGPGISATDGSLSLEASQVSSNDGPGISATDGILAVERSLIAANRGGGVRLENADFSLQNNVIVHNGSDGENGTASNFGGVFLSGGQAGNELAVFEFNTIAKNASGLEASGIACNIGTALTFANNIVHSNEGDSQLSGENCSHRYSNLEGLGGADTNIDADPLFIDADSDFPDSDFRLRADSPCIEAADPEADLDVDFDGTSRPRGDRHDIGAFEFAP